MPKTITIPGGYTTITATDGRKAMAPEHFASKWNRQVTNSMVAAAHGTSPIDQAVARTASVTAL